MTEEINLNDNDNKLLAFCMNNKRTMGEISKFLEISPSSVSIRIDKLENAGLIKVDRKGKGRKTFVRTSSGDKSKEYFVEILKMLKQRGGELSENEYHSLIPFDITKPEDRDKFSAPLKLLYTDYVERNVSITKEGEKFLKENKK